MTEEEILDRVLILLERRKLILERMLPDLTKAAIETTEAINTFSLQMEMLDFRESIEFDELTE